PARRRREACRARRRCARDSWRTCRRRPRPRAPRRSSRLGGPSRRRPGRPPWPPRRPGRPRLLHAREKLLERLGGLQERRRDVALAGRPVPALRGLAPRQTRKARDELPQNLPDEQTGVVLPEGADGFDDGFIRETVAPPGTEPDPF